MIYKSVRQPHYFSHQTASIKFKKTSFVYRWQLAHAWFNVTCFSAFVRASHVIGSVLSIRYSHLRLDSCHGGEFASVGQHDDNGRLQVVGATALKHSSTW